MKRPFEYNSTILIHKDCLYTLRDYLGFNIVHEIPEKVVFDKEKGKTTLLFKGSGKQKYKSISSKATNIENFDYELGFYITYFKFLNRHLFKKDIKEFIGLLYEVGDMKNEKVRLLFEVAIYSQIMYDKDFLKVYTNVVNDIFEICEWFEKRDCFKGYKIEWSYEDYEIRRKEKELREKKKQELSSEIERLETKVDTLKKRLGKDK